MRTYFRGDSRPDIFTEGFKIKDEKGSTEKHLYPFHSYNAIAMSHSLQAAAAFPYNQDQKSYIYIIRQNPAEIYDLHSKSLQELKCDNIELIRMSWTIEQVSEHEIPAKNVIGRMTIERFFKTFDDFTLYDTSPLTYFKIKDLQINPLLRAEKITISEKLLFKKIHNHIVNENKIPSYVPKTPDIHALESAAKHFRLEKEKLDKKGRLYDETTYSMLYEACKAKVFEKEKNCQNNMRILLQDIFIEYFLKPSYKKFMHFIWVNDISQTIKKLFNEVSVKTIDDISRLENISLEKLFFSLHILYLENHSQFKCPLIKDRFEKIIKDYMKIDSYHSPQL